MVDGIDVVWMDVLLWMLWKPLAAKFSGKEQVCSSFMSRQFVCKIALGEESPPCPPHVW